MVDVVVILWMIVLGTGLNGKLRRKSPYRRNPWGDAALYLLSFDII